MTRVTPRVTRLVRVADLRAFREAIAALACDGAPLDARDRFVLLPTRAAAAQLIRTIEARLPVPCGALLLPDLTTARELVGLLGTRLPFDRPMLTDAEREVLLGVACRTAREAGCDPPFRLRPALVSEMLRLYDTLRRNQKDVDVFERLALGRLEPGADIDRGAERLVRQTRFLVAAFRDFERRCLPLGTDEHQIRQRLISEPCLRPFRHAVVTVSDSAFDRYGLHASDWDLLARIPGLERLDVVVTDSTLAGALHERMHSVMPGIEEVRFQADGSHEPLLLIHDKGATAHIARDREEEVAAFVRRAKRAARDGDERLERMALVVQQPLPYVYVAREIFRSGGVPCQTFDALPLAAEPYAAALDLVFSAVTSSFGRAVSVALLGSPHFRVDSGSRGGDLDGVPASDIAALDKAMRESGYLGGDLQTLESLLRHWADEDARHGSRRDALRAGTMLLEVARQLEPLGRSAPASEHLSTLITFLDRHRNLASHDDPPRERELRARTAILDTLCALREAYARFDSAPIPFDEVAALIRRWIDGQTFAPRVGEAGVHLVDAESARFGDFDTVQLAGLVDGEWPERPRRNIFYSPGILKDLGWPSEADRREAARGRFADLMRLPSARLIVSTFTLEADAIVAPSPLLDELEAASLHAIEDSTVPSRIFEDEALGTEPVHTEALAPFALEWATHRLTERRATDVRRRGFTDAHQCNGVRGQRAREISGLPIQVFRLRRPRARGGSGRRPRALSAASWPSHPRNLSTVLRGVGCARRWRHHARPGRLGAGALCRDR